MGIIFTSKVYEWDIFFTQKVYDWVKFEKFYMNGYNFRYGKYMNGSVFFNFQFCLVYEWARVRGLQPHVRNQIIASYPPPLLRVLEGQGAIITSLFPCYRLLINIQRRLFVVCAV